MLVGPLVASHCLIYAGDTCCRVSHPCVLKRPHSTFYYSEIPAGRNCLLNYRTGTKKKEILYIEKESNRQKLCKMVCYAMGKQSLSLLDCLWIITVADLFSPGAILVPCSGVIHPWPLLPAPPPGSQTGHPASTNINLWLSVTASSQCCSPSQESWVWIEERA